jgi:hypothetical protein
MMALAIFLAGQSCLAGPQSIDVGNVRVQMLGDSLLRLGLMGPEGFGHSEGAVAKKGFEFMAEL